MSPKRKAASSQPDVILLSSDSESDVGDHGIQADAQPSPASASKRRAGQDEEPSPKRQKLPVRVKSRTSGRHRSISVEIPFSRPSQRDRSDEVHDSQDESDGAEEDAGEAEETTEIFKTPMERKHVKFDDDDYDEFVTPLERPTSDPASQSGRLGHTVEDSEEEDSEDEDDGSEDDAPEAVSTHEAAAQSAKAAQAAAKAAQEQTAAQKRRRRDRDASLKEQAEARKRAQAEVKAQSQGSEEREPANADVASRTASQPDAQISRPEAQRRKRLDVPDILPPEFLESEDDEDEAESRGVSPVRQNKRIKFSNVEKRLSREDRAPRDERVGATLYRVVKDKADKTLAPKMRKEARNAKEQLLSRNRAPQKRRGFLVKA